MSLASFSKWYEYARQPTRFQLDLYLVTMLPFRAVFCVAISKHF